jgi:predicted SAM-dependent methyltransferase
MSTEAEKILPSILGLLEDKSVLDIGCGARKIVPWATGVDDGSESKILPDGIVRCSVSPGAGAMNSHFSKSSWNVVFSSHTLEHIKHPIRETLEYWGSFVAPGGLFILYLPDESVYQYSRENPRARNPAHWHYLTPDTFLWYAEQLSQFREISITKDIGPNRYSFLAAMRKQ